MITTSVKHMTHKLYLTLGTVATASLLGCGGANSDTDLKAVDASQPVSDWVMVWNDEFDGQSIDSTKWTHEVNCDGGGNAEKQCYTDSPDNSFVADGMLNIVALAAEEGATLPYTSARLNTKFKGDFKYGRFEMRAKLPSGQGSWPAFWMLPTDEVYGSWPKSGEIDIMEAVNLKTVDDAGVEESYIHGTLHYGKDWPDNESSGKAYLPASNPADDFHTFAIEWQEGEIRWYMDGYLYATQMASEVRYNAEGEAVGLKHRGWFSQYFDQVSGELETHWDASPFDQEFHILLNLAVGGNWPENVNNLGIDETAFAEGQSYVIDYVRVYECSVNPTTGKGCETVRGGYKDEETLVEGKAPAPVAPIPDVAVPITIFADSENPGWKFWDCCGGTMPEIVTDDEDHGAVVEFKILDNNGTVLGFNSRTDVSENGEPYNASAMLALGDLSFDMKLVSPTTGATTWLMKVEADGNTSAIEIPLTDSKEGVEPTVGEWQTYTFPIQALSDGGLDVSAIDVIMIFPAWATGEGAIYRVDNVNIAIDYPELVLFEDEQNPQWPAWDCCGGSTPTEELDDEEHGMTVEFSIGATPTVMGFLSADGVNFDASALLATGVVQFEMKMVSAPTGGDTDWLFKVESNSAAQAVEVNLADSNEGLAPVLGEWQTYTFNMSTLADAGLDLAGIDVVMVFPAWDTGDGAVYRIDNARIFNPPPPKLTLFADEENADWTLWDCCAGSSPTIETDDADHGATAQFTIGATPTVMGFLSGEGVKFDASTLLATGVVRFEMKVMTAPAAGDVDWLFKIESNGAAEAVELNLADSVEGLAPVTGEWQTYTFRLQDLADAGLDLSAIDVVMIFPAWGVGDGAVYRVDNAMIAAQ